MSEMFEVETIGSAFRTARKPHVCLCGKTIKRGERYERRFLRVEGELVTELESTTHTHSFEVNPRERGDDDGVEYADPRDYRDGLE